MAGKTSIERLAERLGVESGGRKVGQTTLIRLSLYYLVVIVIVAGFIVLNGDMKAMETTLATAPNDLSSHILAPLFRTLPPLAAGAAAVVSAFLLALPVAFVYVRTRNSLKYDQSLVQTVIMLPVVITSILIVVQNSLALAFSLAGIVAAVRFRNNLKDSRDAVYIFAAVGVGFAAGVGQLAIATFLSLFFCILELVLWKLDLTADHERTFGMLCMPAPPPGHEVPKGMIPLGESGDASAEVPSANTTLLAMGGAEPAPNGKPRKASEMLRLYVTDPEKVRPLVEAILADMTKEFKHRKTRSNGNNQYLLEYQVRLRKKSPLEAVINRLYEKGGAYVIAAEAVERQSS
jgi:hypothetical protein